MLNNESAPELGAVEQVLGINPIPQTLTEWLKSLEVERFVKQPVEIWLAQDLRVLLGMAVVITSADWQDYGLLLAAIKQLRCKVQQLDSEVELLIIPSPDFLVVGVVVVKTAEEIAFTRGAAAKVAVGEIYLGVSLGGSKS
ncbi:hypothetical protein [Halotia branconii]|uniref:Uncharacterized protein n=1 Tax=Halotia branconii CENA392 TaxID=1539056 RepID=A0AAJ6NZ08_9CYAN|nr:hypothetical protein [Halotia branconii]WGV29094.1 hypothetical protein QI031_31535 [Halotia branconii CENA392]